MRAAGFNKSRPSKHWEGFAVHFFDLRRLKLNIGPFVPFLVRRTDESDQGATGGADCAQVIRYSRESQASSLVALVTEADLN